MCDLKSYGKTSQTNRQIRKRLSIPIRVSERCIAISKAQTWIALFSDGLQVGFLSHQFHKTLDDMHRWLPQSLRGDSGIADATACTWRGKGVYCPGLRPKPEVVTKCDKVVPSPCCISCQHQYEWKQTRLAEAKVVRCLAWVRIWLCVFLCMKEFRMKSQKRQKALCIFSKFFKDLAWFRPGFVLACRRLKGWQRTSSLDLIHSDFGGLLFMCSTENVATTSDGPALASFLPTLLCLCQRGGRLP